MIGTCVFAASILCILCGFVARAHRSHLYFTQQARARGRGGGRTGGIAEQRVRRGMPEEMVAALPRLSWGDAQSRQREFSGASGAPGTTCCDAVSEGAALSTPTAAEESVHRGGGPSGDPPPVADDVDGKSDREPDVARSEEDGAAVKLDIPTGEDNGVEVCSVCLSAYDASDVLIYLPCGHMFHEACISRWLQRDASCPQCRHLLPCAQHVPQEPGLPPPPGPRQPVPPTPLAVPAIELAEAATPLGTVVAVDGSAAPTADGIGNVSESPPLSPLPPPSLRGEPSESGEDVTDRVTAWGVRP